jgi:hypothetical protein
MYVTKYYILQFIHIYRERALPEMPVKAMESSAT